MPHFRLYFFRPWLLKDGYCQEAKRGTDKSRTRLIRPRSRKNKRRREVRVRGGSSSKKRLRVQTSADEYLKDSGEEFEVGASASLKPRRSDGAKPRGCPKVNGEILKNSHYFSEFALNLVRISAFSENLEILTNSVNSH